MRAERCVAPDHAVRRLCIDADLLPIREEGDRHDLADRIDGISLNRNRHSAQVQAAEVRRHDRDIRRGEEWNGKRVCRQLEIEAQVVAFA